MKAAVLSLFVAVTAGAADENASATDVPTREVSGADVSAADVPSTDAVAPGAAALTPAEPGANAPASNPSFLASTWAAKWELLATTGGIAYLGFRTWRWGSSPFRFHSEHWFGLETGSGGIDKLGHAYSSYVLTEIFQWSLRRSFPNASPHVRGLHASVFTGLLMGFVEVFDGVSGDHGFSFEDLAFDALGIGFSYLRGIFPKLPQALDYRLEYWPSPNSGGYRPLSNYEGLEFFLALKPAGLPWIGRTPAKFFELHLGYRARGFARSEGYVTADRRRDLFVAIAFNLDELIFLPNQHQFGVVGNVLGSVLHYFQIPRTSLKENLVRDPPRSGGNPS